MALEATAAIVLYYEAFGSYQGDWVAFIHYDGQLGVVVGSYGSCSGCDAFEAEFGGGHGVANDEEYEYHAWNQNKPGCEECEKEAQKLVDFGKSYCEFALVTLEEVDQKMGRASDDEEWDSDSGEVAKLLKKIRPIMAYHQAMEIDPRVTEKLWAQLGKSGWDKLDVVVTRRGGRLEIVDPELGDSFGFMPEDSDNEIAEAARLVLEMSSSPAIRQ